MKELVQVAQNVVKAVSDILPFPISLSDENGYIVGATNPERIGTFHPVSKKVIESNNFVSFSEAEVVHLDNVLPGIAVPLNFNGKTMGVLGIIGPPEKVKPHAEITKRYVELMWRETFYKQIEELENKMKESYIQYLLLNDKVSTSRLKQVSEALDLLLDQHYFCIVIDLGNFLSKEFNGKEYSITVNNLKELIIRDVEMSFRNKDTRLVSFINTERIVVLQTVESIDEYFSYMTEFKKTCNKFMNRLRKHNIHEIAIAAGKLCPSLETIHQSYQEADNLIQNSLNLESRQLILSHFDWDVLTDLLPFHINQSFKERITFRLNKLTEHPNFMELKESFIVYCENGMNISEAAKALFIHRNTLIYRLRKIEELLIMQTRNFQHCMLLYLILKNSCQRPQTSFMHNV